MCNHLKHKASEFIIKKVHLGTKSKTLGVHILDEDLVLQLNEYVLVGSDPLGSAAKV